MKYHDINKYEILVVSKNLGLVLKMKTSFIYKAQAICKKLLDMAKRIVFFA